MQRTPQLIGGLAEQARGRRPDLWKANYVRAGDTPKKRKATGSQQGNAPPSDGFHSPPPPPPPPPTAEGNPNASSGRKAHKRQRSDASWFRSSEYGHSESEARLVPATSPGPATALERDIKEPRKHSVTAMLSGEADAGNVQSGPRSTTSQVIASGRYSKDDSEQGHQQHHSQHHHHTRTVDEPHRHSRSPPNLPPTHEESRW